MAAFPLRAVSEHAAQAPQILADALHFADPRTVALLDEIELVAKSDATALVTGETGTGKELLARQIHLRSGRRGPFVAVNCGALADGLIDAELFGHEAGAFTGATGARAGWFEAANGGTLFLDEIGDLPMLHQVKLLRVLQERQVVRLGSRRPIPVDVRLVAATNVDLHRAVSAGHFRSDLYYRLGVARIGVPALRDRRGDILPLARHFMRIHSHRLGLVEHRLSPDAESSLLAYSWPGNVRELENVIHYALIVCEDGIVRPGHLRFCPLGGQGGPARQQAFGPDAATSDPLDRALDDLLQSGRPDLLASVEAAIVRAAFERSDRNQVHSARLLGISRNAMRTLLRRHGLLGLQPRIQQGSASGPRATGSAFGCHTS